MFTGIIESLGEVLKITQNESNLHFDVQSEISNELKIDQSVAHDGVCLTVVDLWEGVHRVTAISETLGRSTLGLWKVGQKINLERCMPATGRFDGHIVQGHVDAMGMCEKVIEDDGSWRFYFRRKEFKKNITVEKGSITINGVSLTVVDSSSTDFSVAVIPYTHAHTNFNTIGIGTPVNLEFDIIGKYIAAIMDQRV